MDFQGKTISITGAAKGIGRAIALKFAQLKAHVAIFDIDEENGQETASLVERKGGKGIFVKVDITNFGEVKGAVRKVVETFGPIDVHVNNAGWDRIQMFLDNTPDFWDKVININLKGIIYCSRAVLEEMVKQKKGKIINISSDAGRTGSMGEAVYSATKGGIIAFTKTLAREVARYNINVNCICPGLTDTPLLASITKDELGGKVIDAVIKATPFRRTAKPEEIADAVVFFASPNAEFITGQVLSVSGGLTMAG